jgi:hypothetical protein
MSRRVTGRCAREFLSVSLIVIGSLVASFSYHRYRGGAAVIAEEMPFPSVHPTTAFPQLL